MLAAGAVAAAVATAAKWALVGRIARLEQPLWSSFVWRSEVADTFVEMVRRALVRPGRRRHPRARLVAAHPRRARSAAASGPTATGCPRPTSCDSATDRTVNRGCVVQTHLFHDRIMSMDTVTLDAGATLGPHSVVLPAAAHRRRTRPSGRPPS